jgi:hypothetical protein
MKSNLYTKLAVLLVGLIVSPGAAFADAKIKSRQTVSGQAMENTIPVTNDPAADTPKKEGVIRIGVPTIKTGAVGEGINAQELAGAINNTLGEYLKGSRVELVPLEAKLASATVSEAAEKQCDFILYATVSHKKGGGGGFGGMFKAIAPVMSSVIPMAGGAGGAIAGSVASTAINTAANASTNVKPKDEITLDIKLQNGSAVALAKQFKSKAKSGGEDIISPMIEQAAQAILDAAAK